MSFATEHFRALAHYNSWANERIYAACAALGEAEYLKPRRSFFKSLHGTLNHILVADRIWLARFQGHDHHIRALDQQLYGELAGLRVARQAEDALILGFVEGLSEADCNHVLSYRNMAGEKLAGKLGRLLAHLFNHQTHHRGQAHDQLSQTAVAPPPLDFLIYLREIRQVA
jgi:uncharacterized damage-inducible protein DinB